MDEFEWNELSIDVVARGLSALDLVAVQVLLKSAIDAPEGQARVCAFSSDWLNRGPQYFQGEWDTRFGRSHPIGPEKICGVRLDHLRGRQLDACAQALVKSGECAKLRTGG